MKQIYTVTDFEKKRKKKVSIKCLTEDNKIKSNH